MDAQNDSPPICDYEGSTYQTSFWEEGGRAYEDQVEAVALKRLLPQNGKMMLEIGAGAGRNTPRYNGFEHVVLMDYSTTQLQQAQKKLGRSPRYTYVAANAYQLPFAAGVFDCATMIRVLHHIADGPAVLQQIRTVMQPGGRFILEFANKQNLKAVIRYLLRRQSWRPFDPEPIEFVELNYNFNPATTRTWLQQANFEIIRQLTVSHFRIGILKRIIPLKLLVAMDAAAQMTGELWQLSPSVFVSSKAVGNSHIASPGELFRCPQCGEKHLEEFTTHLHCSSCGTDWEIQDGIYNFKQPLNANVKT